MNTKSAQIVAGSILLHAAALMWLARVIAPKFHIGFWEVATSRSLTIPAMILAAGGVALIGLGMKPSNPKGAQESGLTAA